MRTFPAVLVYLLAGACSGGSSFTNNNTNNGHQAAPVANAAAAPAAAASTAPVSSGSQVQTADAVSEENLKVIPPEVVSGAYLTCADASSTLAPAPGRINYGCAATNGATQENVDLSGYKLTWEAYAIATWTPVPTTVTPPPAGSRYAVIYSLATSDYANGVQTQLTIHGGQGTVAVLKGPGQVIVSQRP